MKSRRLLRAVACVVSVVFLLDAGQVAAGQQRPVAMLQRTGNVRVNGTLVDRDVTLFAGDRVQTEADGSAVILVAGRGTFTLGAGTRISLPTTPRFFAVLEQGRVAIHGLAESRGFQLRVGPYVVVPSPEADSTAEVELLPDGAAAVRCLAGWIGVLAIEGETSVFLKPGEKATWTPQGVLQRTAPEAAQPTPTQPPEPAKKRKSRTGLVILVAAGAGGAGAALAFRRKREPVSPSLP